MDLRDAAALERSGACVGVDAIVSCVGTTAFPSARWRDGNGPEATDFVSGAFYTLVPIRPRRRGERRSLRTFPGASLRPSLAFNPRPRRLSTPSDAYELHPDIALYGMALSTEPRDGGEDAVAERAADRARLEHRYVTSVDVDHSLCDACHLPNLLTSVDQSPRVSRASSPAVSDRRRLRTLLPVRQRRRCERRSLRTFSPVALLAGVTRTDRMPFLVLNLFGVLKFKAMGEQAVVDSGIPYTILRPGRLTDGPYTSYDVNTVLRATR